MPAPAAFLAEAPRDGARGFGLAVEQHLRGREADEYREQHGQRRAPLMSANALRAGGQRADHDARRDAAHQIPAHCTA